jgi:MoaA/NifB/PqqE/SkfB family radical SAM enzyme
MVQQEHPLLHDDCLSIEVTTRCNSACSHCFVRARGTRGASLSPRLVRTLLQEGYEAGYRRLHITGGEPLLWVGLLETLDHAFEMGYETVFLNTNGTLLKNGFIKHFSAYPRLTLSVSLQGPRPLHDRIRGKGSHDRTSGGIKAALDAGLSIHIFLTICRSLLPGLPRYADGLFHSFRGIKQLTLIQIIRVANDRFDLSREVLAPEDFIDLVKVTSLLNLYGLKTNLLNNPLATVVSRAVGMGWFPPSPPLYSEGSVMVMADCNVTLAHSTDDSFGRYEPGKLWSIINSDKYRITVLPDGSTCPTCIHVQACTDAGMLRPSDWRRDMFPNVPYCRRVLARAMSPGQLRNGTHELCDSPLKHNRPPIGSIHMRSMKKRRSES